MTDIIVRAREAWQVASTFPLTKEQVYPELVEVQEFNDHHDKEVLEYGCGAGSDALSYLRRGNMVTCCDIVPGNLYAARVNIEKAGFLKSAEFQLLDNSYPLPFDDDTFDLINSNGVIHHIPEGAKVIREFYNILKPGGLCYVMLYTEMLWKRFESVIKKFQEEFKISEYEAFCWCTDGKGTPYARKYTEAEGIELFEHAGFKVLKTQVYNNSDFRQYKVERGTEWVKGK